MVTTTLLRALGCLCVFVGTTVSRPSIDYGSFDDASILPLGGMLHARSEPVEIKGVYGGRKKRYIIERDEPPKACRKKDKCNFVKEKLLSNFCLPGTYFDKSDKKCSCVPCKKGRPTCADECDQGQHKKKDSDKCEDDPDQCKKGEKKDPATKKCVPDTDDADRKGHCPDGQVLNEREGPSNDKNVKQSCQLDDRKDCKEPNVPESRKEGDELNQKVKVGCGRDKDGKIREAPKCNKKKEWRKSSVDSEGNAVVECVPTLRFKERLKNRLNKPDFVKSVKDFHNKMADKFKNQREVGDKALKDSKEEKAKRQKQVDEDAKKEKAEMDKKEKAKLQKSKCEAGQLLFAGALEQNKRDKKGKRDAAEDENDSYAKTTLWFEETYLTHDDRLKELPKDLDLSKVADDVDFDAYIKVWAKYIDDQKPLYTGGCNYSKRSSLSARCSQRRSVDEDDDDTDPDDELDWLDAHPYNTSTLVQRDFGPGDEPAMTTGDYEERLKALESRNLSEIEKRQAQIVLAWLIRLGLWASNAGLRLSQAAATISNSAPRLWAIMGKHGSKFLFQPAKATQGAKGGGAVMEKTSKGLWDKWGRELTKCMLEGLPSAFL